MSRFNAPQPWSTKTDAILDAVMAREKAWDALAARRDAEIERGEQSAVSGAEVLARLRAELA